MRLLLCQFQFDANFSRKSNSKMKVLLILSALCAIAVATEYTWTDIRPVELLPKFQDRLKALGVPARTVERQQRIVGGNEGE
jgi:hypothetical protein